MRLGFFITSLKSGGAERVMSILVNNFVLKGHEVHLFVYENASGFYKIDRRIIVHEIYSSQNNFGKPGLLVLHFLGIIKAKRIVKKYRLDCLVGFITFVNCITIIVGKLTKVPVGISERNDPFYYKVNAGIGFIRKVLYKYADSIILQTERSINSFNLLNIKLPDNKIVILNPIDDSFRDENKERKKVILSVGRLSFEKGHDLLIKAFAKTLPNNWELHFIGEGVEKEKLITLTRELGIDSSVVWHGIQSNVKDFLNSAAIYVLPSRTEGFPNALCEAMACGCAVVSFNCPNGPSEIIKSGENGLLVDSQDIDGLAHAINSLIENEQLREHLGKQATKIKDRLNQNSVFLEWEKHLKILTQQIKIQ